MMKRQSQIWEQIICVVLFILGILFIWHSVRFIYAYHFTDLLNGVSFYFSITTLISNLVIGLILMSAFISALFSRLKGFWLFKFAGAMFVLYGFNLFICDILDHITYNVNIENKAALTGLTIIFHPYNFINLIPSLFGLFVYFYFKRKVVKESKIGKIKSDVWIFITCLLIYSLIDLVFYDWNFPRFG